MLKQFPRLWSVTSVVVGALALASCEAVLPTNPFDPETPADQQEKGTVSGRVVLVDSFGVDVRQRQLDGIRVGLLDENGRRVEREGAAVRNPLNGVDADANAGDFAFDEVVPGVYSVVVEGVPSFYASPVITPLRLLAGGKLDVGDLTFTVQDAGPGSVTGEVLLDGDGDAQRTVSLFVRGASDTQLVAQTVAGAGGAFAFAGLDPGTYAVVAESAGHAPAWRLDVDVSNESLQVAFAGEDAIVLPPVSGVVLPEIGETVLLDDGAFYVAADEVAVAVFGGLADPATALGVSGLRISTDANFADVPFTPFAARSVVPLPAREGRVELFVQLEARSEGGFVFTSPVFSTSVVRDVTAPVVLDARVAGAGRDVDGTFLAKDRALVVAFDAQDDVSGVDRIAVAEAATQPDPLTFADVTAPPGLVRFNQNLNVAVDGATTVFVQLRDKAGNQSGVLALPTVVDTTVPDVSLVVANASGGVLPSRLATLSFDTSGAATDLPVAMQVRLQGQSFGDLLPFGDAVVVVDPADGVDGDTVTFEARVFDRVGNSADLDVDAVLRLRGDVIGHVVAESVPLITPDHAGAVVNIGGVEGTSVADGFFGVQDVVEGVYQASVTLDGYETVVVQNVAVAAGGSNIGVINLPLSRGDLRVEVDVVGGAAASGVVVSVALEGARSFVDAAPTDQTGAATFSSLPATRAGETYRIEVLRVDDGATAIASSVVVKNAQTTVNLSLAAAGDFDLCRLTGPCDATTFLNAEAARVRLRGAVAGVDALVVVVDGGAPTTVPFSVDNQTPIAFGTVTDGRHDLLIQPQGGGVDIGGALRGSVVVDRVAPTNATLVRVRDAAALDDRFTRQSNVVVVANADVGTGDVAPASSPRLVIAASAPATPPAELFGCTNNIACSVALAASEGLQRVFSFSCDKAGNCAAPVDTFVIRDVTAPAVSHGVSFDVSAVGSVVQGGVVVLPTFSYKGSIAVGAAKDGNDAAVVDENGAAVADVFAFATSLDLATLPQAQLRAFSTPPVANTVRAGADVVVPALDPVDTVQVVFVDVRDAAGNAVAVPLQKSLRIDDDAPSLLVSVATATNSRTLPFTVSSAAGGEVPARVDVRIDQGAPTSFPLPLAGAVNVTLPDVDGPHDVEFTGVDAVGNATVVVRRVTLDRGLPHVDLVRCTSQTCTDDAINTLLTTNTTLTLSVTAGDDASTIAAVEVTAGATTTSFPSGSPVTGVVVAANVASTISVVAIDAVGNRSAPLVRNVRHDNLPPTLTSVTLNGGATLTRDRNVDVVVAGASADVTGIAVQNGAIADCRVVNYAAFAATTTLTVAAGDGVKTVGVCLKDGAGNVSATSTNATITLDTLAPTNVSLVLGGGVAVTRNPSLTATIGQSGATQMKLVTVDNDVDVEAFVAVAATANVVVEDNAGQDGVKTVIVVLRDAAGNETTATASILLDRVAPTAPSVSINSNATVTASPSVTLTLAATGATEVQIAPDGTADTEAFVPFSTTALTTLQGADCAAGVACKTVQVVFRDEAGNLSAAASDSIILDSSAPAGTSLTLASSVATDTAGFATSTSITASLAYPTDATRFKLAEGAADCALAAGYANLDGTSPDSAAFVVSAADGQKVVVACFQDAAGNSSSTTASIVLDRARPLGSILVNNNATSANAIAVTIAVTPQSDDVNRVAFVNDAAPTCNNALTYQALTASMAHSLTDLDGARTVFACFRDVAGNFSFAPVNDGITLDRTAPALVFDVTGTGGPAPGDGATKFTKTRDTLVSITALTSDATAIAVVNGSVVATCAAQPFENLDQPFLLPLVKSFVLSDVEGVRDVTVCAKDGAGNITGQTKAITLDRVVPAGSIALTTTGGLVTSTTINGTLTITPVATDPLRAFASADPAVDCATAAFAGGFGTLSSSISQVVPAGDGQKFVVRCLQDQAGNLTKISSSATLDASRPTVASFSLDTGGAFSLDTTVTADFTGVSTDVTQMVVQRAAIADCAAASFVGFSNGSNVVGLVEGSNTVFACVKDAAGNVSDADAVTAGAQPFTDTIVVDTQNPTLADFNIGGIGGAAPDVTFIASRSAVVKIARTDLAADVVAVAFENTTINCATASYELLPQPVPTVFNKNLDLAAGVDGARSVAVCVKDSAGRTNGANGLTRSITLDTTPPSLTTFNINSGAGITNNPTVTVTLASNPANDPLLIQFFTDPATNCAQVAFSGTHAALPATRTATLTSTSGTRFVVGCVQDRAGNVASVADDIELDVTLPQGAQTSCSGCNIVGGVGFTNTTDAVALDLDPIDVDVVSALTMVSEDETDPRGANRTCTVDANCRQAVGEQCRLFPVAAGVSGGPPTTALRCVEVQPDISNVFVSLATAAAPVNAGSGVAATPLQGVQKIAIAVVDTAGNISDAKDFSVVRDITAPTPVFNLSGLSGVNITNTQTVFVRSLTVANESVFQGVNQVGTFQASSLTTFADAATLPYAAAQAADAFPVTLSNGDGLKTVAVRFVDNAGNVNNVALSDIDVTLDTTKPTDPRFNNEAVSINGTQTITIGTLAVPSTDANPRSPLYSIVGLTNCGSITGITFVGPPVNDCRWDGITSLTVQPANLAEGENRVRLTAFDTAGNASNEDFVLLTKDATLPAAPTGPKVAERSGSVTFAWTASTSSDVVGYLVEYGYDDANPLTLTPNNFAAEGPSPVFVPAPQTGITLTGLSDDTTIEVRAFAVDGVGNRSAPTQTLLGLPNPVAPTTTSTLARVGANNISNAIIAKGPRAFAKKGNAVCAYDIANPAAMSERANSCTNLAANDRLRQFGRFLYVTNETATNLRIIDTTVSNPALVNLDILAGAGNDAIEDIAFPGRFAVGIRNQAGTAQLVKLEQVANAITNVSGNLTITQTVTTNEAGNALIFIDSAQDFVDANARVGLMASSNPFSTGLSFLTAFRLDAANQTIAAVGNPNNNSGTVVGFPRAVRVDGKRAYIGTTAGMFVVRIDDNNLGAGNTVRAVVEGSIGGFECSALDVLGGYVYCNDASAGSASRLYVIDVADVASPQLVGRSLLVGSASPFVALDVEEGHVYGVRTDGGIESLQLAAPTRFALGGTDGDEPLTDAVVDGNHVIAMARGFAPGGFFGFLTETSTVAAWDIHNRDSLQRVGTAATDTTAGEPTHLSMFGHSVVVVTDRTTAMDIVEPYGGTSIVNLTFRINTTLGAGTGNCPAASAGSSLDVTANGNYAAIASSGNGGELEIWALLHRNASGTPTVFCLSRVAVPNIQRISEIVDGQIATISSDGVLRIVSLSNLTTPTVVQTFATNLGSDVDGFGEVELRGNIVYVARSPGSSGVGTLRRIDLITFPVPAVSPPTPVITNTLNKSIGSFAVSGSTVIAADGKRISVGSNPDTPSIINGLLFLDPQASTFQTTSQTLGVVAPWHTILAGPTVIAASDGNGLQVLTISR